MEEFNGHTHKRHSEESPSGSQMGAWVATLCNSCTIVCNCAHLWPCGPCVKGISSQNHDKCWQLWRIEDKCPKPHFEIPHLDFPDMGNKSWYSREKDRDQKEGFITEGVFSLVGSLESVNSLESLENGWVLLCFPHSGGSLESLNSLDSPESGHFWKDPFSKKEPFSDPEKKVEFRLNLGHFQGVFSFFPYALCGRALETLPPIYFQKNAPFWGNPKPLHLKPEDLKMAFFSARCCLDGAFPV